VDVHEFSGMGLGTGRVAANAFIRMPTNQAIRCGQDQPTIRRFDYIPDVTFRKTIGLQGVVAMGRHRFLVQVHSGETTFVHAHPQYTESILVQTADRSGRDTTSISRTVGDSVKSIPGAVKSHQAPIGTGPQGTPGIHQQIFDFIPCSTGLGHIAFDGFGLRLESDHASERSKPQ